MANTEKSQHADDPRFTYYAVLATKHKRELITEEVNEKLKELFAEVQGNRPIVIANWQWRPYGIILTAKVDLMSGLPTVLRQFRLKSNREIPKLFEDVKAALNGDAFWTASFCFVSADSDARRIILEYMASVTKMAEEAKLAEARAGR